MLLEGKKIIVTGGITGIGKATVLEMVREGASVVSMSRTPAHSEKVVAVLDEAKKLGAGKVLHIQADVSKQEEVNRAFDEAATILGGLDAMANSAGWAVDKPAEDLTEADLWDAYSVHVCGTAFTNMAAFRHMKEKGGSIINHASYAGVVGMPGMPAYSAAKGAVLAYSRVVAKDWAKYWIRTNVICPAVVTELLQIWYDEMPPERLQQIKDYCVAHIPLGGTPGKVVDAANLNVFLASDKSSFLTGQVIGVDGGYTMPR